MALYKVVQKGKLPRQCHNRKLFGDLKIRTELSKKYESSDQLKKDIKEYIEYYNNNRIKLNLKGMSPMEYRAHYNNKSNK